ncbi:hypothetical protein AAE478_004722 [Parahypoxylon ruwenzoriense]
MLRLSSLGAHRIGTSYICASCFAASQLTRSRVLHPTLINSSYHHHGRPLSTTPRQASPTTETLEPTADQADSIAALQQALPKKKSKKKKKKPSDSGSAEAEAPPLSKKAATHGEQARQIQVLEGALQALKNVLASQNINVDAIKNHSQIADVISKSKPSIKAAEGDAEAQDGGARPEKRRRKSKKGVKESPPDEGAVVAAEATPESPAKRSEDDTEATPKTKSKKKAAAAKPTKAREKRRKETAKPAAKTKSPKKKRASFHGLKEALEDLQDAAADSEKKKKPDLTINRINPRHLDLTPIEADRPPVPCLSYGLDRVLFNPGVCYLQDPRSRVYNFDPYLSEIMPIQEFDFNALKQYVTSSKDSNLIRIAKEQNKKYTGSTSSMTSMLSHFHYLLSSWREINTSMLSRCIVPDSVQFTRILRGPAAIFLHWKDGTYAIDADKEYDTANILSMLGKSMEKLLTLSKEDYERYRHVNSDQITEEERNAEEAFHYTGFGDFMMRSQLDAYDPRMPGTGMFDLKTRAVVSIRMDAKGFHKGLGYEIRTRFGQWESFEREYYDMIRSAFLKYSLQVRMGRMDGIFVAFHNTQRIFGFQYIPLSEMDLALHGAANKVIGDKEYKLSLALLNDILDRATKKFPKQSLRIHFETRTSVSAPFMYIFAKPVTQEDINEVQNASRASIEAFEREVLGLVAEHAEAEAESAAESAAENDEAAEEEEETQQPPAAQQPSSLATWEEVRQMVEDAVDDDEIGVGAVREAIEDALEQSGLLHAKSSTDARGYVDALLDAITSSKPSKLVESSDSAENQAEQVDELAHEPVEESSEESVQESTEEPVQESTEESVQESTEESVQESTEGSVQESTEGSVQESTEGSVQESTGEPVQESVERGPGEAIELEPETATEKGNEDGEKTQDATEKLHESGTDVSTTPDNGQGDIQANSDTPNSIDRAASEEQVDVSNSRVAEEEEEGEEEEEDDDDDDDDDVDHDDLGPGESKRDLNTASSMSPLKNLIVNMAQRIDERILPNETENSVNDSSKLKEFERILGQLIARSKDEQSPSQEDGSSQDSGTQTEPETQDKTESVQSETGEADAQGSSQQSSDTTSDASSKEDEEDANLLGMVLTIKNKVNGQYVIRPEKLTKADDWTVEYNIEDILGKRAKTIYQQCQSRRRKIFADTGDKEAEWYRMFCGDLSKHTEAGRRFRQLELKAAKKYPIHIFGHDKPLTWEEVFGKTDNSAAEEAVDGDDIIFEDRDCWDDYHP